MLFTIFCSVIAVLSVVSVCINDSVAKERNLISLMVVTLITTIISEYVVYYDLVDVDTVLLFIGGVYISFNDLLTERVR